VLVSCSRTVLPAGTYEVFSYRQTQQALIDSARISTVPQFIVYGNEIRVRGDFCKAHFLQDSIYTYAIRCGKITLKSQKERKKYFIRVSSDESCYIDLDLSEKYIQEISLVRN
jgi:hypothetical protein